MSTQLITPQLLKQEIQKQYGTISRFKKHLIQGAVAEYGGLLNEITILGCKISYNNNPNCFASFIISTKQCGYIQQLAFGLAGFTTAGIKRIGANNLREHYFNI